MHQIDVAAVKQQLAERMDALNNLQTHINSLKIVAHKVEELEAWFKAMNAEYRRAESVIVGLPHDLHYLLRTSSTYAAQLYDMAEAIRALGDEQ